jgi:P2 family phage contractile tail tube protein
VTASIRGTYKELPSGKMKAGAKFDGAEHTMTVNYYKLEVAGATIYEVDLFNNILIIDGKDMLESFKANQ